MGEVYEKISTGNSGILFICPRCGKEVETIYIADDPDGDHCAFCA